MTGYVTIGPPRILLSQFNASGECVSGFTESGPLPVFHSLRSKNSRSGVLQIIPDHISSTLNQWFLPDSTSILNRCTRQLIAKMLWGQFFLASRNRSRNSLFLYCCREQLREPGEWPLTISFNSFSDPVVISAPFVFCSPGTPRSSRYRHFEPCSLPGFASLGNRYASYGQDLA